MPGIVAELAGATPAVALGRASRTGEIRALTGLRGVAALNVVVGHYDAHQIFALHLFDFHDAAVDVFFALSSFTLCLVYGTARQGGINWRSFAVARFARVYPLYFAVIVLNLLLDHRDELAHLRTPAGIEMVKHLFSQVFLLAALPFPSIGGYWVGAAWSVSIEAVCYIFLFPALYYLSPRLRSTRLLLVVAGGAASLGLVAYVRHYSPMMLGVGLPILADKWAYWVPLIRGVTMFVAGWAAFLAYEQEPALRRALGLATDCLAGLFLVAVVGEAFSLGRRQDLVLIAPFLIGALMDARSLTARVLASPPIHMLGLISYSIYLLHLPVYSVTTRLLPRIVGSDLLRMGLPLLITLVAATGSYFLFETPARVLIRRWLGGYRRATALPRQRR